MVLGDMDRKSVIFRSNKWSWKNGKWGYIDKTGKVVIDFKYDDIDYFRNDMACVRIGNNVYFINKSGEKIIDMLKYKKEVYFWGKKWNL